ECELICGIDEAGRGPLAGPVCAGAVILKKDVEILYLNDSKKLSAKKRDELFDKIKELSLACSVGLSDNKRIDEINILNATYEAMRKAIAGLGKRPDILLNDYVKIPEIDIRQIPITHGDAQSVSIAAASIMAKVTRDRIMDEYEKEYPGYGFSQNKGYGTQQHIDAIRQMGLTPIHRLSFVGNLI
ncbi:MAG: ribonuclease HII, partial [Lachnospiraceae bacterium]|nr:ribonuclease HII [Lachnospiraceae bacterium]